MTKIQFLKKLGHQLLDEYIFLDLYRGSVQAERRHAYRKLEVKLKRKQMAHFSMMHTEEEVLRAIKALEKMIEKRKEKLEILGKNKKKFAPNLMELQRNIKFEKVL